MLFEKVEHTPLHQMWFQYYGAPTHYERHVIQWIHAHFPERWIGLGGFIAWSPKSPYLNHLDFFLWGHLKQLVYIVEVNTREQLLHQIIIRFNEIHEDSETIALVYDKVCRCHSCIQAQEGYLEQLL